MRSKLVRCLVSSKTEILGPGRRGPPWEGHAALLRTYTHWPRRCTLKDKGHEPGVVDGKMGPKTMAALRDFQKTQGMEATGLLDDKTVQALGMDGAKINSAGS